MTAPAGIHARIDALGARTGAAATFSWRHRTPVPAAAAPVFIPRAVMLLAARLRRPRPREASA